MNNDTLNALILRHGDNLLRRSGWPDSVGMTPVAPETVPGWLFASGVLDADEILALTTRLCQALNDGRAKLLTASAQRLAGTPARLHLYPAQSYPRPEALTDFTCISLPYAREWLTKAECGDLLAFLKDFIDRICDIVRQDAKRIAAALVPSAVRVRLRLPLRPCIHARSPDWSGCTAPPGVAEYVITEVYHAVSYASAHP